MNPQPKRCHGLNLRTLERVVAYIEDHISEDIGLDDLAAVACISRFHFVRMFRRSTGTTPMAYVKLRRVEHAKRLLGAREMTVCDIAAALGFCDQSHFTRVFRRRTGITPGGFARIHAPSNESSPTPR